MANKQIKKVNWWHEAIIDWMLENPDKKLSACAEYFDKSVSWISVIIHSAAFEDILTQRKMMHAHMVSLTLTEKLEGVAHTSVDLLEEQLAKAVEEETMSIGCARDTTEMAFKMLGYNPRNAGMKIQMGAGSQVNVGQATPEALARARGALENQQKGLLLEKQDAEPVAALPSPT